MTQPTLPVLGGGERELKELPDGWLVQLRNGTTRKKVRTGVAGIGKCYIELCDGCTRNESGGFLGSREDDRDIALILGPAEETHGDGTVTKLCALPVTMAARHWQSHDVVRIGPLKMNDHYLTGGCTARTSVDCDTQPFVVLRPKPTPSPTYTEKLIEAVQKGEVVLPHAATKLEFKFDDAIWVLGDKGRWGHATELFGTLPLGCPNGTSIDLATVRDAAEVRRA